MVATVALHAAVLAGLHMLPARDSEQAERDPCPSEVEACLALCSNPVAFRPRPMCPAPKSCDCDAYIRDVERVTLIDPAPATPAPQEQPPALAQAQPVATEAEPPAPPPSPPAAAPERPIRARRSGSARRRGRAGQGEPTEERTVSALLGVGRLDDAEFASGLSARDFGDAEIAHVYGFADEDAAVAEALSDAKTGGLLGARWSDDAPLAKTIEAAGPGALAETQRDDRLDPGQDANGGRSTDPPPPSPRTVADVVRHHKAGLASCMTQDSEPPRSGEIALTIAVRDGRLERMVVDRSTVDAPGAHACLRRSIRRWPFGAGADGDASFSVAF